MSMLTAPVVPSQAAAVSEQQKENVTTIDTTARLIAMSKTQLQEEMTRCGFKFSKASTKDDMLKKLGIPARQWKAWRRMKVTELRQVLDTKSLKRTGGNKQDILDRLGVFPGFGETSNEKLLRELNESRKKRKTEEKSVFQQFLQHQQAQEMQEMHAKKKTKRLDPADDPKHVEYTLACCATPRFGDNNSEPAGCICYPDGSMSEVWRCMNCKEIPARPNAPPIEEFSDHGSDNDEDERGGGGGMW
jgi:hypothetical protein